MATFLRDLKFSLRTLLKTPAFALVAIVTLALGIGANSAIFSVVYGVLLRPLPYENPDRLVLVWLNAQNVQGGISGTSMPDFREWRARNRSFDHLAATFVRGFALTGTSEPEQLTGAYVHHDLFATLGIQPRLGRAFRPEEETWGNHRVVILNDGLWKRRFAADPNILGKTITLNNESYEVVGVMPPDFPFPTTRTQLFAPIAFAYGDSYNTRGNYFLITVGRLKSGVSIAQAHEDMGRVLREVGEVAPEAAGFSVRIVPLLEQVVGNVKRALWVLLAAVGFVLLIACANVASLLLARATSRQREIAIRTALGAARSSIVRQLLTESLLLSFIGGGLGLLLARWGVDVLTSLGPANLPRLGDIRLDGIVLLFTIGISILTAVIFGLVPALQSARTDLHDTLKEGGRSSTESVRGGRIRRVLVFAEVALSVVLLISSGLLVRSFLRLQQVSPGFEPSHVLSLLTNLPDTRYPSRQPERIHNFVQEVLTRVQGLPGVQSAAAGSAVPMVGGGWTKFFTVTDRPPATRREDIPLVQYRQITSDYFRALGIPVRAGRSFSEQDHSTALPVAIVNEALAKQFFSNENPLGKRIRMSVPDNLLPRDVLENARRNGWTVPELTIVGVVGSVRQVGLAQPVSPEVYIPHVQGRAETWRGMWFVVRTSGDPGLITSAVRGQVWSVDPNQPVSNVLTMEDRLDATLAQPRFQSLLLGIFASVALLLTAVGLYGMLAYSVAQRTHEIGIRTALGAQPGDVIRLILRQGMVVVVVGILTGLGGAYAASKLLRELLFETNARDPFTFAGVAIALAVVALLACWIPARRATRVDPLTALRYE